MKDVFDATTLRVCRGRGGIELANRVWRSATWMAMAGEGGQVDDALIDVYRAYAAGGIGAIITGFTGIAPEDMRLEGGVLLCDDSFIAGHRRLTEAVHAEGSKVFLQAAMVSSCRRAADGYMEPVPINAWLRDDIARIVGWFGDAARRAEQAGYDGVQIHAAHGFFLSRFISPLFNQRTDEYGGDSERRARILVDVLRDMRAKTSDGFGIIVKINARDEMLDGLGESDFLAACKLLEAEGIDAIEVSSNNTSHRFVRVGENEAYFLPYALPLMREVDVPVILVGGHRSLEGMNEVLNTTDVEYLSISRPFIREPDLLRRWQAGDTAPAACVSCNACYSTPDHACIFNLRKAR